MYKGDDTMYSVLPCFSVNYTRTWESKIIKLIKWNKIKPADICYGNFHHTDSMRTSNNNYLQFELNFCRRLMHSFLCHNLKSCPWQQNCFQDNLILNIKLELNACKARTLHTTRLLSTQHSNHNWSASEVANEIISNPFPS